MRLILLEYIHEFKSLTAGKLLFILSISFSVSTFSQFVNKYVYSDWDFLIWLGVLISIDTFLGTINAVAKSKWSSTRASKFFFKIMLYCVVLIVVHVVVNFKVNGDHPSVLNWFDDIAFSAMIAREATSILEKIALLKPDLFPAWILKRLEYFDQHGKLPAENE